MTPATVRAIVRLPLPLRAFADGRDEVEVAGATVETVLEDLLDRHPRLRARVLDHTGALRGQLALFLDRVHLPDRAALDRPMPAGAALDLVPVIAGG